MFKYHFINNLVNIVYGIVSPSNGKIKCLRYDSSGV